MESSISVRQMVSAAQRHSLSFSETRTRIKPTRSKYPTRSTARICRFRVHAYSKRFEFLEYRDYKRPSRLLPATDLNICTETTLEKIVMSLNLGKSDSLFKVALQTSRLYDSSLSDLSSGVLLMLIDENGDSVLQRLVGPDELSFQSGSVDEFTFKGPKLGKIEALWVGLGSGQWRLGGVNLTVISSSQPSSETDDKNTPYVACQYNFEADDILLGGGSDTSVIELRPSLATESSEPDPYAILKKTSIPSTSPIDIQKSNEQSMREYANLKFSLLFYDLILISAGTTIASFLGGENISFAFLTGGAGGFLYLWLLQRSVDGLQVPELRSGEGGGGFGEISKGLKSPVAILALVGIVAGLGAKFGFGDVPVALTAEEVVVGMFGFLVCKVAVVLAAVKPLAKAWRRTSEDCIVTFMFFMFKKR